MKPIKGVAVASLVASMFDKARGPEAGGNPGCALV